LHKKWKEIGISAPYPQVQFKIGVDGKTSATKIVVSSGNKETDRKALTAISTVSFTAPPLHTPLPFEVKVGGKTDCGETK
jgi:TonB family protein